MLNGSVASLVISNFCKTTQKGTVAFNAFKNEFAILFSLACRRNIVVVDVIVKEKLTTHCDLKQQFSKAKSNIS